MKRRLLAAALGAAAMTVGVVGSSTSPANAADFADLVGNFTGDDREEQFWYAAGPGEDLLVSFSNGGTSGGNLTAETNDHPVNGTYDPVAGNFDGDAYDEILWYAPGTGADSVWNFTSPTSHQSRPFTINGRYRPVVGDFTGDGIDEILWYAPGTAADFVWSFNSSGGYTTSPYTVNGSYQPVAGSFGTNATDDILWYAPGTARDYLWDFNPGTTTYVSRQRTINGTFRPIVLDMFADGWGGEDILWYAPGTTPDFVWDFIGGNYESYPFTVNGSYYSTPAGDFLGDGHDDITWYGDTSGYLWDFAPDGAGGVVRYDYELYAPEAAASASSADAVGSGRLQDLSLSGSQVIER